MKTRRWMIAVLAVLLLRCGAEKQPLNAAIAELPTPTGAGAAEPFLHAMRDGVLLSWLEPVAGSDRAALRFSRYRAGRWSVPRTIVERNDLVVNWADFPSIVEDAKGVLFAHWLQKGSAGGDSSNIRMAASKDGGATWSQPFLLNRDGKEAEHGFVTLVALPDGGVGATWLDGRKMTGLGDSHEAGGDMGIRYASVDEQGTIADEVEVDGRTCECCATGMTVTSVGPVIAYRDRSPDDVRDISHVAKTANGWTQPIRMRADGWKISGCPVNGPQIDAIGPSAVAAWFTAPQDQGRAYVAFSDDGGLTFRKAVQIGDGKALGRLDVVLLDEKTALVTWLERTATGAEIRARRVSRNGKVEPAMKVADSSTARGVGFARIARVGRDVYFAWTELSADTKRVRIARGRF